MTKNRSKNHKLLKYIAALLLPVAILCIFYVLSSNKEIMNSIQNEFSLPALRFLGNTFSSMDISFLELAIAIAIIAAVIFIFKLLFALLSVRSLRILVLLRYVIVLLTILAWIWNGYCWLWNSGYYADSFSDKSGLSPAGITVNELYEAAEFFRDNANELSYIVPRGEDGIFCGGFEYFAEYYDTLYILLEEEFPFLSGEVTMPKPVYFSKIMSYMGYTGLLFPFTGETYINTHQPAWDIPNTIAHEIAHQKGIHFEAEANFLGIAACIQSDDISYRYSGYVSGFIHLTNALYSASPDLYAKLLESLSPQLTADLQDNAAYWQDKEGSLHSASDAVYTAFLKVNMQPSGLNSYGECVDLLVLWLNTSSFSPKEV